MTSTHEIFHLSNSTFESIPSSQGSEFQLHRIVHQHILLYISRHLWKRLARIRSKSIEAYSPQPEFQSWKEMQRFAVRNHVEGSYFGKQQSVLQLAIHGWAPGSTERHWRQRRWTRLTCGTTSRGWQWNELTSLPSSPEYLYQSAHTCWFGVVYLLKIIKSW